MEIIVSTNDQGHDTRQCNSVPHAGCVTPCLNCTYLLYLPTCAHNRQHLLYQAAHPFRGRKMAFKRLRRQRYRRPTLEPWPKARGCPWAVLLHEMLSCRQALQPSPTRRRGHLLLASLCEGLVRQTDHAYGQGYRGTRLKPSIKVKSRSSMLRMQLA